MYEWIFVHGMQFHLWEKTFLLLSMPGLENYLSCVLLFIYYFCTMKDCRRVKFVREENKGA